MRLSSIFGTALSLATLVLSITHSDAPENDLLIIPSFPESNPFGQVVNGEKNSVIFSVENQSGHNVTIIGVSASIHHAESGQLIKNLTAATYSVAIFDHAKVQVPYAFFSEFKPGDARLSVWVDYTIDGTKRRASAYDLNVTIVEPEISVFDFKLLSTYLVVAVIVGGLGYFAYLTYMPQPKKSRSKKPAAAAPSPVSSATTTGAGYEEEWIPEHHLKKTKKGILVSGDELSGSEASGTESRRRKGRK